MPDIHLTLSKKHFTKQPDDTYEYTNNDGIKAIVKPYRNANGENILEIEITGNESNNIVIPKPE